MGPLTKQQHEWGFVCGRISALEGELMTYEFFLALASLERPEELFHRLQDTSLRDFILPGAASWEDWSTIIDTYVHNRVMSLRRDSPDPAIANIFSLAEDYLNLKRALMNQGSYPFLTSILSEEKLAAVAGGDSNLLPDILRPSVALLSTSVGGDADNPFLVDIVLDGAYFRHYVALGASLNAPSITMWVNERALERALVVLWRAMRAGHPLKLYQQYFLPIGDYDGVIRDLMATSDPQAWGGLVPGAMGEFWRECQQYPEDEQIARFEALAANYLTELAKQAKLQTAGPERVAGYLWGLWVEAFNLKLVISGQLNRLEREILKSRVRGCYV